MQRVVAGGAQVNFPDRIEVKLRIEEISDGMVKVSQLGQPQHESRWGKVGDVITVPVYLFAEVSSAPSPRE